MLLHFTFVPMGLRHRPWRRGARRRGRAGSRPMPRWLSPPRGVSGRPPSGSSFSLENRRRRRKLSDDCHHAKTMTKSMLTVKKTGRKKPGLNKALLPSPGTVHATSLQQMILSIVNWQYFYLCSFFSLHPWKWHFSLTNIRKMWILPSHQKK